MTHSAQFIALLACASLTACSSGKDEPKPAIGQNQELLHAVQQPLDQAQQIEKQVQDAEAARRKQLEQMEQ